MKPPINKLYFWTVLILAFTLASGCAQQGVPQPQATEAPAATQDLAETGATEAVGAGEVLKAAVLLPGAANDQSWSQLGYEGILSIGEQLGAETAYSENVAVADALDALRDYASRGFKLIVTHGGQYEEAVLTVADEFPDADFVVIAGSVGGKPNVAIANVNDQQIGYTEGYLAAKMSETHKIGLVSHLEGMPVMDRINGSQVMGARAADPNTQYCVIYIADGEDVAAAREAATSLIDQGVDVVYSEMNRGWQGVADAALERGVWTNSRDPAAVDRYGDVLLFGIDYGYDRIYPELARRFQEGTLGGERIDLGYHTPGGGFQFQYTDNVPQELITEIEAEVIPFFQNEPWLEVPPELADSGCR
jgi:simple sugar transport system substrate-binding protein/basic membrane protein A